MRKALGAAALALAVATAPAWGQRTAGFLGRVTPSRNIVNVPIDTGHAVAPLPQPQARRFNFVNLFSGLHMPTFPPGFGKSPFPSPDSFPSTHYPNKFQPVRPIVPGR